MPPRRRTPKSHSQFETMDNCPLSYKFRYIDKVPFKKGEHLVFGTAFHEWRFRYMSHCIAEGVDSDWDVVSTIAKSVFHDKELPMDRWDEFVGLARSFAENRQVNHRMGIEVKFGVNRDLSVAEFDEANYFRGIIDGLEIQGDVGVVTDTKTARSSKISFFQLRIYAAFVALQYPAVKEWRLIYDFARLNRFLEETILAENLKEIRDHVRLKVDKMENRKEWPATPGEHCMDCPFLSRCDYRIRGLKAIRGDSDVRALMEDHWHLKAQAAQAKRQVKAYVENNRDVQTDTLRAGVFTSEKMSCDKRMLIRILKSLQQDPTAFVEFPTRVLKRLRYDKVLGDDVSNAIFIESREKFEIKKKGKVDNDEEEEDTE